jgi:hypothetical protein
MNEFLLQRIEKLERSVRRWRLATIALGILLACSLACGGTFTSVLVLQLEERDEIERNARMQAEAAQQQADEVLRQVEAANKGP